jgi:hypothetical protein
MTSKSATLHTAARSSSSSTSSRRSRRDENGEANSHNQQDFAAEDDSTTAAAAADAPAVVPLSMHTSPLCSAAARSPSSVIVRSSMHESAEVYGFCLYVSSFVIFVLYLLWSLLPDEYLISLGITYYPSKWWALALPAWFSLTLVSVPILSFIWNMTYTLDLHSTQLIQDEWTSAQRKRNKKQHDAFDREAIKGKTNQPADTNRARAPPAGRSTTAVTDELYSIPDVRDISLGQINQLVYTQQHPRQQR